MDTKRMVVGACLFWAFVLLSACANGEQANQPLPTVAAVAALAALGGSGSASGTSGIGSAIAVDGEATYRIAYVAFGIESPYSQVRMLTPDGSETRLLALTMARN
jgi:hypothetical protein